MKLLVFLTICVTVSSYGASSYEEQSQSVEGNSAPYASNENFTDKNGYPQPQPPCLTCLPGHPAMPGQANPRIQLSPRPYPSNPAGQQNPRIPVLPRPYPSYPGNPGTQGNFEPDTYSVPEMPQPPSEPPVENIQLPTLVPGSPGNPINPRPNTYSVPRMPQLPHQPQQPSIPSQPVPEVYPYYPVPVQVPAPAPPAYSVPLANPGPQPNLPAPGPYYQGGQPGQYSGSVSSYPEHNSSYGYPKNTTDFRKLRTLHGNKIIKAKLRYFKNDNINFVVISCPKNPTPGAYTWILADSKHTSPSFGVPQTVALVGGINIEFIAKLGEHGKWEGKDLSEDEKHRFRKVGCIHGATQSFVKL